MQVDSLPPELPGKPITITKLLNMQGELVVLDKRKLISTQQIFFDIVSHQ